MLFDDKKDTYQDTIEQGIAFSGKGLDFYTEVKASYFQNIVKNYLPDVNMPHVLDIGCGHGLIHPHFKKYGFKVDGIDVAKEVIPLAKQANPEVSYNVYDGIRIPFEDNHFDVTLAICVMHHVPPKQWLLFLSEMKRVLKPNGIAVVFEHNPLNPITRYVVANNEIDADAVLLSEFKLKKLFKAANFSQTRTRNILFTPFDTSMFRALDNFLGWCPFGAQYFAVGKTGKSYE